MMGISGFTSKKELKASIGKHPIFIETSMFGEEFKGDGTYNVVGPTPHNRKWFATVVVKDNKIAKVT